MTIDYTLYLVTDRSIMSAVSLEAAVEQAVAGGCTMVQLREKDISSDEFYRLAVSVKCVTDRHGVPLIINDRADIALLVNAAGIHIGQNDLPAAALKKIMPQGMVMGVSVSTAEEARRAVCDGADYLGVGAMFPTNTKRDAKIVSMDTLDEIRSFVSIPIVVIGGINKGNASMFRAAGVDGMAVVSEIIARPDIKAAAEELKQAFLYGSY